MVLLLCAINESGYRHVPIRIGRIDAPINVITTQQKGMLSDRTVHDVCVEKAKECN